MTKQTITTPAQLKAAHETAHPGSFFFTRNNMKFAGDTMANFGLRQPRPIRTVSGDTVEAYELYRRKPVKHGIKTSFFFDSRTFERRQIPA